MFKKLFDFDKKEWGFIFYDWAESAHTVIIGSFIFPILWSFLIEGSSSTAGVLYGFLSTAISLIIAVISPILGTMAEYKGMKKKLFLTFFFAGVGFTALLSFYPIDPKFIWITLILYTISMIGYAGTNIFYDSFIVDCTSEERMDKVSTAGYAFGYIGGSTIPLVISLLLLQILPNALNWSADFPIKYGFRICFMITAIWWLLFSIPFIKNCDQKYGVEKDEHPIKATFQRLGKTFKDIRSYKIVFLFLIAYFFYIDGVHTIIAMAMPYANDVIGSKDPTFDATSSLLPILIAVQIIAFFFALLFSYLSKKFKTRHLLIVTICIYCFTTIFAFFVTSVSQFWILGFLIATSQGGIQALSRSYFGKIVPEDKSNEFFGFYSIFGKIAAIMGPALVSLGTLIAGNHPGDMRYGVLSLIILFIIGLVLFIVTDRMQRKEEQKEVQE